jgi:2-phosphosulfolactate phosphatase
MPAPDLPPPPAPIVKERPLSVHLLPRLYRAEGFSGCVAIVVDTLRASTTICAALEAGASRIVPTLSVEEARVLAARPEMRGAVLGGERAGVRIEGFDLGNSPAEYTRERVGGRPVVFTTTNGTAALIHVSAASRVLVGAFCNLSAVCRAVARDPRPVHIVCAGTRDEVSLDDCLPAGAMVASLLAEGRHLVADDSADLCLRAWLEASRAGPDGVLAALNASRGGRGLSRIGLGADVEFCARADRFAVVPMYDPRTGSITALAG